MLFAKNERIPTVILLCIYTFMCSMHFIDATESGINLFEYLLCCITDHYYLLYALLFFLIAYSAMSSTTVHDTAKIRYGVLGKYYASQIRIRMKKMLVLTFLHLLIPFVIAITKLEYHSGYNIISSGGEIDNNYEVIYFLSRIITNSFMATLCVSVYLYLGMSFISILFAFAFEIWNRKGFIATVVIVLVNVFTGFMTDLNEGMFKFLFLNDYFIFHHGLLYDSLWCFAVYIAIMMLTVTFLFNTAVRSNSNRQNRRNSYLSQIYSRPLTMIAFYLIYFGLALIVSVSGEEPLCWNILKGFSYLEFNVIELLFYIAPTIFSLFIVNMEWEKEFRNRNIYALIRYGKKDKWVKDKSAGEMRFIVSNISIIAAVSFLSIAVSARGTNYAFQELSAYYELNAEKIAVCGILSVLFRSIEWILLYFVDRSVVRKSANTIVAFLSAAAVIVIGFVFPAFNPLGKGSLYQLLEIEIAGNGNPRFAVMLSSELLVLIGLVLANKYIKEKIWTQ